MQSKIVTLRNPRPLPSLQSYRERAARRRKAEQARASLTLMLATLASILALSGPLAVLYAAMPPVPMPVAIRVALVAYGIISLLTATYIGRTIGRDTESE